MSLARLQTHLDEAGVRYFSAREATLERRTGKHNVPPERMWGNIIPTLLIADAIRSGLGAPVRAVSVHRDDDYNRLVGGEEDSEHRRFCAGDFQPISGDFETFLRIAIAAVEAARAAGWNVGLIIYNTFVHIDVDARAYKGRNRTLDKRSR